MSGKQYKFITQNNIMENFTNFVKNSVPQKLQPGVGGGRQTDFGICHVIVNALTLFFR
jgi:hypothetical protein